LKVSARLADIHRVSVDLSSLGPLIFLLILSVMAAAVVYGFHRKQKRREALALFALHHGFEFAQSDPFGLVGHPFRLFTLGVGRGCENVMWGTWQDLPVKEADFWYYTESSDDDGRTTRAYHHYSVAIADVHAVLPHVAVDRENLVSRFADRMGFRDIEFESDQFNRTFQVRSTDREFAYRLIDARMMRWLLAMDGGFGFEVQGNAILVHGPRRNPTELIPLLGMTKGFRDHIPRLVWSEYGEPPGRERSTSWKHSG
jgi:hypothetical protein